MPKFEDHISIPEGYHFSVHNGIHSVLDKEFKNKLDRFLEGHSAIQKSENYPFLDKNQLHRFPFIDHKPFRNEIFTRKQDLALLEKLVTGSLLKNATVLELGGWNAWLTQRLSAKKMDVVSVDIFTDEENGLGSRKFYEGCSWISVQADVNDTNIYKGKFDLVVFNHCLNFYRNPLELIKKYMQLLTDGGLLIILGADITGDMAKKQKDINAYRGHYLSKYGFKINFYDGDGFFDANFYNALLSLGFVFTSYRFSLLGRLRKNLLSEKNGIFIYSKK